MREFAERGRVGLLQHQNTLIYSYSGRNRGPDDTPLVAEKTHRISAGMFLFRWEPGLEGLFINREPVTQLPVDLSLVTGGSLKMGTPMSECVRWSPPICRPVPDAIGRAHASDCALSG